MSYKNFFVVVVLISFFFNFLFAQELKQKTKSEKKIEVKSELTQKEKSNAKKIWNEFCPVMGEPVDPEVQTVEYNGKVIGFCCKSCIKKFKKDPEKYLKNLSEDGKKFIKQ